MHRCRYGHLMLTFGIALGTVALAQSQTIRIPDFRERPSAFPSGASEPCDECGRVASVREIAIERKPAIPASVPGGTRGPVGYNIVGAVMYLPLSSSSADRPFVGGVGTPEMRERFGGSTYEITMRMDDGTVRFVQRGDGTRYHVGDRVRAVGGGDLEVVTE
jgi:outer membrane lipoprotein SlyB